MRGYDYGCDPRRGRPLKGMLSELNGNDGR